MQLFDKIKNVNQTNTNCTKIRKTQKQNKKNWNEMLLKIFKNVKNILFFRDKLWISIDKSKLDVIKKMHDQSTIKHLEIKRIYKFVKKSYYWIEMKNSIERYIQNFHVCKRFKVFWDWYFELLNFFSSRTTSKQTQQWISWSTYQKAKNSTSY